MVLSAWNCGARCRATRVRPSIFSVTRAFRISRRQSGGGGTKLFRPVPTLGALAHHLEKVAQSLAVDVDLDVVAQRGGRVVEGDVDFAELGAEVLR